MNRKIKPPKSNVIPATTTPAEEWGERIDTGRQIARGIGEDVHDPRSGGAHCAPPGVGQPNGMPPVIPESLTGEKKC